MSDDVFGDFPLGEQIAQLFAQLMTAMSSPNTTEFSQQWAAQIASEGQTELNVDPSVRIEAEQFLRVAELHLSELTGRDLHDVTVVALNRGQCAQMLLKDLEPYLTIIGNIFSKWAVDGMADTDADSLSDLPEGANRDMLSSLNQLKPFLPQLLSSILAAGFAGQVALRSFGAIDFPIPREDETRIALVVPNIQVFAERWELPFSEALMWVTIKELATHVALSAPAIRSHLDREIRNYLSAFSLPRDPFDPELSLDVEAALADPNHFLGVLISDEQRALRPRIDRAVGLLLGYADALTDAIAARILPSGQQIAEAIRRDRVERHDGALFVERMFGLELSVANLERGAAFVQGVQVRGSEDALRQLLDDPEAFPTESEYDAPGLWLARLGHTIDDDALDDALDDVEIPDYLDFDD